MKQKTGSDLLAKLKLLLLMPWNHAKWQIWTTAHNFTQLLPPKLMKHACPSPPKKNKKEENTKQQITTAPKGT